MIAAALPAAPSVACEILEDCFVDPVTLFDSVRMAAADLPRVVVRGVDEFAGQSQLPEAAQYRTVDQLQEFVAGLARQVRCSAFFDDDRVVNYTVDFQFDGGDATDGLGHATKFTTLLRDGVPVLRSFVEVEYAGSTDAAFDFPICRREATELLARDELAEGVFEVLRSERRLPPR